MKGPSQREQVLLLKVLLARQSITSGKACTTAISEKVPNQLLEGYSTNR